MKLKKSIEKAKQQRQKALHKLAQEESLTEKTGTSVALQAASSSTEKTETPVTEKEMALGAKQPAAPAPKKTEGKISGKGWVPPVYSESKAIELDLKKLAQNRCICMLSDVPEVEYYKILRTNVQHRMNENGWNTIMITSVQPGEGKTLTSINLAVSFAKAFNQTVLLVDCDLKRQKIHKYLDFPFDKGIVDYLMNDHRLKDLIVWPNIEKLTLISGGRTVSNTTELLGSPKMKALVKNIKTRYDDRYVIFDVPPILGGADAIAFAPLVDCVLMVVEEGRTSIRDVKKALEMIPAQKFLGFVLNKRKDAMHGYYY
jgi:non-specific protein-tyrosine kinase